jgi:formamidopyrimidine-DNA glycosylase
LPELPEVETVRRGLVATVVGRGIERVEVGRARTVRRTSPEAVIHGLSGTTITGFGRRGKYLLGDLDSGEQVMIHLRMSGQLLLAPTGSPRPPHSHVVLTLAATGGRGHEELRFVDPRTFGEVVVFAPEERDVLLPELARLGPDPLADDLTRGMLRRALAGRRRQLKALLLDQAVIAGIGNIYADEILHAARLGPWRTADSLSPVQLTRLHRAIRQVLHAAVASGGSTLRDAQYVDVSGAAGSYQHHHRVVDREGQWCASCGRARVRRAVVAGRSTYWCPRCQRR